MPWKGMTIPSGDEMRASMGTLSGLRLKMENRLAAMAAHWQNGLVIALLCPVWTSGMLNVYGVGKLTPDTFGAS